MEKSYDVVIIGSGFGGAITGCRLSQAGRSVCILERGKRWGKSEFPRSVNDISNVFWDHENYNGLLDYRNFKKVDVIQASGVGGGSLVYFNVHLETPPRIFENGWPEDINRNVLDPYYDIVRDMVEAKPIAPPPGQDMMLRTKQFLEAVKKTGREGRLVNIAVYTGPNRKNPYGGIEQDGCVYCSNDLLGCHLHAKNTLDLNYIPLAEKNGAEVFPLHLVNKIEPMIKGGYKVTYENLITGDIGNVIGTKLIVAAGTLGSNELLLQCKFIHQTLPLLSKMLGQGFSTNGDFLLALTHDTREVIAPTDGPSITAVADFSTEDNSIFIEDLGFPDALAWYLEASIPNLSRLVQSLKFMKEYIFQMLNLSDDRRIAAHVDIIGKAKTARFLPYLGMGSDAADGIFKLRNGQLDINWSSRKSKKMFRELEDALRQLSKGIDGKYLTSPIWRWPAKKLLTAHPLGGCRMSDSEDQGVVNQYGEVWNYPDLYVADGSIVPTALSVNPSMTISALAERIAEHIVMSK